MSWGEVDMSDGFTLGGWLITTGVYYAVLAMHSMAMLVVSGCTSYQVYTSYSTRSIGRAAFVEPWE